MDEGERSRGSTAEVDKEGDGRAEEERQEIEAREEMRKGGGRETGRRRGR